jgi:AAA+ superfamily predicted ATPase
MQDTRSAGQSFRTRSTESVAGSNLCRRCVLFFDEFDTLGKERGDLHETGEIKRVVSSLPLQIDAVPSYLVVVTATNHPELLDRAVWRRFQLRLRLPPPTQAGAEKYLEQTTRRLNLSLGLTARTIAEKLAGASISELEDFVSDVARRYVLSLPDADGKKIVTQLLRQAAEAGMFAGSRFAASLLDDGHCWLLPTCAHQASARASVHFPAQAQALKAASRSSIF